MDISGLETSAKCAGKCGEPIDLLKTHLVVTVKAQKMTLVLPTPASRSEDEIEEPDSDTQVTVGTRSGVGEQFYFHNNECAAKYFNEVKGRSLKLKLNVDDADPYKAGAEIMHGSDEDEEDGDDE